jgi:hypothetical protein
MGRTTMKSDENQIAFAATLASAMSVVVTGATPHTLSHVHAKAAIYQILARGGCQFDLDESHKPNEQEV